MKRQRIGRIAKTRIRKEPPIVRHEWTQAEAEMAFNHWFERFSPSPWYVRLWRSIKNV